MKPTNSLSPTRKPKQTFSVAIRGDALQGLIKSSVASAADAARLTGTLISAVAANPQLQECNPASVVAAALRGEGQKLTYGQDYHLVPFRDKCQYIISYKGLLHLLIATGEVADTNCIPVHEGEYKGRNKKTKRPEFDFSVYDTTEEEEGHEILGWYFYVELRNGYTASEYMRLGDILNHAARYSQSFNLDTYNKLNRGEFSPQEAERIRQKSPWYGNFDIMAAKTVIRKLLNSGFVPLANSAEIRHALDVDGDSGEGTILSADILNTVNGDEVVVAESTGEVINDEPASGAAEVAQNIAEAEAIEDVPDAPKTVPAKRGRPRKAAKEKPEPDGAIEAEAFALDDDYESSFFGED